MLLVLLSAMPASKTEVS